MNLKSVATIILGFSFVVTLAVFTNIYVEEEYQRIQLSGWTTLEQEEEKLSTLAKMVSESEITDLTLQTSEPKTPIVSDLSLRMGFTEKH